MENPSFYIVDVFAEQKYAGNQLAVVRGAGNLSDGEMQSIAAEINYSDQYRVICQTACSIETEDLESSSYSPLRRHVASATVVLGW